MCDFINNTSLLKSKLIENLGLESQESSASFPDVAQPFPYFTDEEKSVIDSILSGEGINAFTIVKQIGYGSQGTVYCANHKSGFPVVLKVINLMENKLNLC